LLGQYWSVSSLICTHLVPGKGGIGGEIDTTFLKYTFVLFLFFAATASFSQKIDPIDSLQELSLEDIVNLKVDVASGQKEKLISTASSISIIDKYDIEHYGFTTLAEALETVAGISIYRTYFKRDLPTARGILQDNYSNKVLVLINKVPLWNAITGEGNLERVALNDIERIEILKGPASVVYGTNAYSGVINIVLKSSDTQQASIKTSAGSHEFRTVGANYSMARDNFSIFMSANSKSSNGSPYLFTGENGKTASINEYINSDNISIRSSYKNISVLFNTFKSEESFLGIIPSFESGAGQWHTVQGSALSLQGEKTISRTTMKVSNTLDWQQRSTPRSEKLIVIADINGYKNISTINIYHSISKTFHLEAEASNLFRHSLLYRNFDKYSNQREDEYAYGLAFDGDNNMKDRSMWEQSVMLQGHYAKNKISSDVGIRYTINNAFGDNISGRASFIYSVSTKQSVKILYGESYRSPSIFETDFISPAVLGNANLKPETSKTMEVAYMGSVKRLYGHVACYHAWYNNLIYRKKESSYIFRNSTLEEINVYSNGSELESNGIEAEICYKNPDWASLFINGNYIAGSDANSKSVFGRNNFYYISPFSISAGISIPISITYISTVANYYSKSNGPFYLIERQYTVDISGGAKHLIWGKTVKHSLFVKNIFDRQRNLPEYVRKKVVNTVPNGYGRYIGYSLSISI